MGEDGQSSGEEAMSGEDEGKSGDETMGEDTKSDAREGGLEPATSRLD